jgi:hypothetical protein
MKTVWGFLLNGGAM